jgi:AcrR family transcriptional regulator
VRAEPSNPSAPLDVRTDRPTAVRILDEAERLFAERGYRGTSLAEVADRVGIRGPSLFNHFANKRALYEAVLGRLLRPFFAMLDELRTSEEEAAEAVLRMLDHHAAHPRLASLIQQAVLAGGEQLEWLIEGWYGPFFERVQQRVGAGGDALPVGRAAQVMGFDSLILGYVTLAPMHARLLGLDPLEPEALDAYRSFLRDLIGAVRREESRRSAPSAPGPAPGDPPRPR